MKAYFFTAQNNCGLTHKLTEQREIFVFAKHNCGFIPTCRVRRLLFRILQYYDISRKFSDEKKKQSLLVSPSLPLPKIKKRKKEN